MKKSGKKGSKSELSINTKEVFTIEDLTYAYGYQKTIETLYRKLLALWQRSQNERHNQSYTVWARKHKLDNRLMPIMKQYGYCDSNSEWALDSLPSKADAVFLAIKLRNSYREAKK